MIRKITPFNVTDILNEKLGKKYSQGADVVNIEYPREPIKDSFEHSVDVVNPVEPVQGSNPVRAVRRDDQRFDRYA